jgi:hypothetical protein
MFAGSSDVFAKMLATTHNAALLEVASQTRACLLGFTAALLHFASASVLLVLGVGR